MTGLNLISIKTGELFLTLLPTAFCAASYSYRGGTLLFSQISNHAFFCAHEILEDFKNLETKDTANTGTAVARCWHENQFLETTRKISSCIL